MNLNADFTFSFCFSLSLLLISVRAFDSVYSVRIHMRVWSLSLGRSAYLFFCKCCGLCIVAEPRPASIQFYVRNMTLSLLRHLLKKKSFQHSRHQYSLAVDLVSFFFTIKMPKKIEIPFSLCKNRESRCPHSLHAPFLQFLLLPIFIRSLRQTLYWAISILVAAAAAAMDFLLSNLFLSSSAQRYEMKTNLFLGLSILVHDERIFGWIVIAERNDFTRFAREKQDDAVGRMALLPLFFILNDICGHPPCGKSAQGSYDPTTSHIWAASLAVERIAISRSNFTRLWPQIDCRRKDFYCEFRCFVMQLKVGKSKRETQPSHLETFEWPLLFFLFTICFSFAKLWRLMNEHFWQYSGP